MVAVVELSLLMAALMPMTKPSSTRTRPHMAHEFWAMKSMYPSELAQNRDTNAVTTSARVMRT